MVREVIPGDKVRIGHQALIRLTAQVAPVMHKVDVFFRTFYVPNRIVWQNFDNFITGGKNNSDESVHPYLDLTNVGLSSIYDYMGIPTGVANRLKVNALPFRAYNMICNYYFRDQNLQEELPVNLGDGFDGTNEEYQLQNVLWRKGYFTSATASPQAGNSAGFTLGGDAPVMTARDGSLTKIMANYDGWSVPHQLSTLSRSSSQTNAYVNSAGGSGQDAPLETNLYADLSDAGQVDIETLRNAFKVQSYLEKLQRAGYHIKDWLKAFFGVNVHDSRIQQPEYLGGSRQSIFFSEVLQTSETQTTPLAQQAGTSTTMTGIKFYDKYIPEHGFIMTLMYIRPTDEYCQGLERQWTRENKFDYYLPQFANLGEQAILNKELYAQGTDADNEVFGYQTRYAEYRTVENRVAGFFKDNSFKAWTMTREFENAPQLNEDFLKCEPTKRIYATQGYDNHILVDCANYFYASRLMPKYVIPATL